jgi:hypothetical protein
LDRIRRSCFAWREAETHQGREFREAFTDLLDRSCVAGASALDRIGERIGCRDRRLVEFSEEAFDVLLHGLRSSPSAGSQPRSKPAADGETRSRERRAVTVPPRTAAATPVAARVAARPA